MAYYDEMNACAMNPAARAKDIAVTMGQIARKTLASSAPEMTLANNDFFTRRLRAAQLPPVEACQFSIFTWLRVVEDEAALTRLPKAEVRSRPWLFNLKHRISHMFYSTTVH